MTNGLNIAISSIPLSHRSRLQAEICEHKGIGHPDSICDGVAEAASQALCRAYLECFGAVQHHNVDKALLVGGEAKPQFGGGHVIKPIRLILCGRATPLPTPHDVQAVITAAAERYLAKHLRVPADLFQIEIAVRNGSPNLQQVFARAAAVPIANDTSFGVGFAPLSRLEQTVLEISELMKSAPFRTAFPAAGDDFKIMGRRVNEKMAFTIALAFIDRHVQSVDDYFSIKQQMVQYVLNRIGAKSEVRMNTLDAEDAQHEDALFLTVTGLSAEHGDDGQVGRGNRVNGLITPSRPMSLEAAAGKNPVAHVGKLYNLLAQEIAQQLAIQLQDADEVTVQILSAIGMPVDQPQLVSIEIVQDGELTTAVKSKVKQIVSDQLNNIDALSLQAIEGKKRVF
jgi:S-adenosylmethionine synthetase